MESNDLPADLAALDEAERARDALARDVVLPPGHDVAIGSAVAVPVLAGVAGGVVYVLSGRRWLRAYREEPARLGRAESSLWFALVVGLALAGLALLVLER